MVVRFFKSPTSRVGGPIRVAKRYGRATYFYDIQRSGAVDLAPRTEKTDFEYRGGSQVVPGAHPLPLSNEQMERLSWPLVSPYMPSPHRAHPYFSSPLPELPHFECDVPVVHGVHSIRVPIVVPVFNLKGQVAYTRALDPFLFGEYPRGDFISFNHSYWMVRTQNYLDAWDFERKEIFRKAKKNWPNTGTGLGRVHDRKTQFYPWGGRTNPMKPWNCIMPRVRPLDWNRACRMMMTLKMLQGKLMIVDRLELEEPSTEAFQNICSIMKWDVRHDGGGVLFMDGGSRITPSLDFNLSFFYGSFFNGRVKLVRPTIMVQDSIDFNRKLGTDPRYFGPKGAKNPVPLNRFNCYDAMEHHLLVLSEGAVLQLEQESHPIKLHLLPPHISQQAMARGMVKSPLLGDCAFPIEAIELEVASRMEEAERSMYEPYYDNPYKPWQDEAEASYEVDGVEGFVKRHVKSGQPGSWRMLQ